MQYLIVKSLRCIVAKYEIFYDHDLKDFDTFKIGGKAKYIVIVPLKTSIQTILQAGLLQNHTK